MFKINVGRLNIKLMSYAVLTIFTAIDLSPTRMLLHPNQPQQGLYSHRFVSPPACCNIPTNLRRVWIKKTIVIEFKENFNGKIWSTKSY